MDYASMNNHLDIIKYFHENRTEGCTSYAMDNAASSGHFELVMAMDSTADNGHSEIVKILHENSTEGCTTNAMDNAARRGYLDIAKILHEKRAEVFSVMHEKGNGYGCGKWKLSDSPIPSRDAAASRANLEIVKYLNENCTAKAMLDVIIFGHFNAVKYLHENRTKEYTARAMI
ncbi:hypothetical protein THRCLA_22716 [Thraustotheca clavata]|uniref:Ankyrin repeat n=1 Tax=Thraustotheca clavata TaxID=74557 RepID=A0A1V9YU07_9STRA|nr:hypothetical protein THRCLA_22716 [Thraustotheca clavata]